MKKLLFILLMPSLSWAACPLFTYPENHKLDQEVNNICQNELNPIFNVASGSSMTVTYLNISTISVVQINAAKGTIANFTATDSTMTNITANGVIRGFTGRILQVVASTTTASTSTTSTCGSYVNTTLGGQPITMQSASSQLITVANFEYNNTTNGSGCRFRFAGSNIGLPSTTNIMEGDNGGTAGQSRYTMTLMTIWTPGSTTVNAPVLQICVNGGTCNFNDSTSFTSTMYNVEIGGI